MHTVYAAFDPAGVCLYVGRSTRHPAQRWAEHSKRASWARSATRWEVLPDIDEAAAVARLAPLHNKTVGDGHDTPLDEPGLTRRIDQIAAAYDDLFTRFTQLEARLQPF